MKRCKELPPFHLKTRDFLNARNFPFEKGFLIHRSYGAVSHFRQINRKPHQTFDLNPGQEDQELLSAGMHLMGSRNDWTWRGQLTGE
jgi:hypothetical protein